MKKREIPKQRSQPLSRQHQKRLHSQQQLQQQRYQLLSQRQLGLHQARSLRPMWPIDVGLAILRAVTVALIGVVYNKINLTILIGLFTPEGRRLMKRVRITLMKEIITYTLKQANQGKQGTKQRK